MALIHNLKKNDKHGVFSFNNYFTNYSTGFLPLDYINAFKAHYIDENGEEKIQLLPGVMSGKFITIFGGSGGGKSTLAKQIAYNIIKPFEDGVVIDIDCEHASYKPRIYDITGFTEDDERYVFNDEDTYIETVIEEITKLAEAKKAEDATYEVDGRLFGKDKIKMYVPSVIIIDSLPSFVSKDCKFDTLEGQMSNNRETAMVGQFYKKMLGICSKYNIIVIAVNHLRPRVKTDMFDFSKPQLMMLKDNECLPRGEAPIFYASTVFRSNPSAAKSKAFTTDEHGFDGFLSTIQVSKTKTTFIGGEVNLVFREDKGFDPVYSIYQFAYDCGLFMGNNPNIRIKGAEEFRFSKKNFGEQFENNEDFRIAVLKAIQPYLEAIAGCKEDDNVTSNIDASKLFALNNNGELEPVVTEDSKGNIVLTTNIEIEGNSKKSRKIS